MEENINTGEEFVEEQTEAEAELEAEEVESQADETEGEENEVEESEDNAKKQRASNQIERLKKQLEEKNAELAKLKSGDSVSAEDAVIARLETRGVLEPTEQAYVLKYAKAEGISPIEALNDELVKDKLAFFKKQREQKASTFAGTNRTKGTSNEVDRWIAKFKKDGSLPENNPALTSKILDKLQNK